MDTQIFWNVIGEYNVQTLIIQIGLFIFLISAIVVSYMHKINWSAKFALGIANLFIGFGFFALYGTEPIQKYFALPLYSLCGVLFLYESWHSRNDVLQKPNMLQAALLALWGLTGIKSVFFNAYEDLILLICGLYGAVLLFYEIKASKTK